MGETIFYKRDEDALSYAFLTILEKMSKKTLRRFLKICNIEGLYTWGNLDSLSFQKHISKEDRPDGILYFGNGVVVFENKIDLLHSEKQLSSYYSRLVNLHGHEGVAFLIGFNREIELIEEVKEKVKAARIPNKVAYVFCWQEIHKSCRMCLKENSSFSSIASDTDVFLVNEFKILLEEMELDTMGFEGLKINEMKAFARAWEQLIRLEKYLKKRIPLEFEMLGRYRKGDKYSSMFLDFLGFHFKKAWGKNKGYKLTYLYIQLNKEDGCFDIGIACDRKTDLKRLLKGMDFKKLVSELKKLGNYSVYNIEKEELEPKEFSSEEIKQLIPNIDSLLRGEFGISRSISFTELHTDFEMGTDLFPQKIIEEIMKLKPIIHLFNSALIMGK